MIIRENHREQLKTTVVMAVCIFAIILLLLIRNWNNMDRTHIITLCIVGVIGQLSAIGVIIVETKSYYVNKEGIIVTWCYFIKSFVSWTDIKIVQIEKIQYNRLHKYDYLICSKISIKWSKFFVDKPIIDADWLLYHPRKVVAIRLSDMSEGQLEEFWSYVPDRLKS